MEATFQTSDDGMLAIRVDQEAAQAVFASILFAAKFHDAIAPLTAFAKQGIDRPMTTTKGTQICR